MIKCCLAYMSQFDMYLAFLVVLPEENVVWHF